MGNSGTPAQELPTLERVVVASVAVTAKALADVAPELTFLQWRVLVILDADEGASVGHVAAMLDAKLAAVSRLLGRMRRNDLIHSERDEADARVVRVTLTGHGRALRTRVVERRRHDLAAAIAEGLPADAVVTLDRVATALGG